MDEQQPDTTHRDNNTIQQQLAELRASEAHFRAFVEGTDDLVTYVDANGQFVYVNPATARFVNRTQDECVGMLAFDLIHPDDREATQQAFGGWIAAGTAVATYENRLVSHSGTIHYVNWTIMLQYNDDGSMQGMRGIARDITALKEAEAERISMQNMLLEKQNLLQGIIDNIPVILVVKDRQGRLIMANRTAAQTAGTTPQALIGHADADFLPAEMAAETERHEQQVISTGKPVEYVQEAALNGSVRTFYTIRFPLFNDQGEIYAVGGSATDITERRRAEQEHTQLQEQLIEAQRSALRELSTPLIPVADNVLVMPLIGSIDSTRAQQVLETLLEGVAHNQASTAILDITGVPVIDTQVANALLQAARAVRLLGAEVVLTGIRPDVAQTLVHLGADLSDVTTHSSLQSGITAALNTHEDAH
jgi:anti-anti-sigma factor